MLGKHDLAGGAGTELAYNSVLVKLVCETLPLQKIFKSSLLI